MMKNSALILLLLASLKLASSQAIIIRHDTGPKRYEVQSRDFPAVFYLERQGNRKVCAATIIHEQWAITAAHCTEETLLGNTLENKRRYAVEVAGELREIDLMILHPDYDLTTADDVDLALLRFREAFKLPTPVPLQLESDELGQIVSIVGWGFFGIGTTGRQYDDGVFRRARNRITQADKRLQIDFEDPRDRHLESLELEGMPALGDSGGPAFIETATGLRLAGIAVGEIEGADFSEETQGKYGARAVYERLSSHLDWIEAVIGDKLPFGS
jgi:hypothetical protein